MTLTTNEKSKAQDAVIASVLDIIADEVMMITKEAQVRGTPEEIRAIFLALYDNLTHRAKDYRAKADPVRPKGGVLTL